MKNLKTIYHYTMSYIHIIMMDILIFSISTGSTEYIWINPQSVILIISSLICYWFYKLCCILSMDIIYIFLFSSVKADNVRLIIGSHIYAKTMAQTILLYYLCGLIRGRCRILWGVSFLRQLIIKGKEMQNE